MAGLLVSSARFVDGDIRPEQPMPRISEEVMSGNIVVLKGVFAADELLAVRRAVWNWSKDFAPAPEPSPTVNCHCLQSGISRLQKTPHVYHSYNFNRISALPADLAGGLFRFFQPLLRFQNAITGNSARFEAFDQPIAAHPQVIQYPLGGGLFGRHIHPLSPQRIGMIVALSRHGVDFDRGGTCFDVDGVVIDIEPYHDIGDIALFRFDVPHWVTPADLRRKFDWHCELGRWSMVLPTF
jgi:hypothetical protein